MRVRGSGSLITMSCALAGAVFFALPAGATDLYTKAPDAVANTSYSVPSRQLLSPKLIASDPQWAITFMVGSSAGDDKLIWLLTSPWNTKFRDDYFAGGAVSRKLVRFWNYFTIEAELGVGARFGTTNSPEGWAAIFFRYDYFPWNKYLFTTVAVSTGVDYLSRLPPSETYPGDKTSHVLHYFSPEITFALPEYKQHELLIRYHHRSGVFGTFNGVWGGSNVISLGYRYRFDRFDRL
ncbi:MAG: hypothetical protein ABI830_11760 [Pseudolabrys sp.]